MKVLASGATDVVAAASTNAITSLVVAVPQGNSVAFEVGAKLTGTNAANESVTAVFILDTSVSGTNWNLAVCRLPCPITGTAFGYGITNLTVGAIPYVRVGKIENSNTNSLTNVTVLAYPKREI